MNRGKSDLEIKKASLSKGAFLTFNDIIKSMKTKLILLFILFLISNSAFASSINPAVYQSMRASAYRNNYNRNMNNRVVPYWRAQSNYSTRDRLYHGYSNYNNYVNQYNNSVNQFRGYR